MDERCASLFRVVAAFLALAASATAIAQTSVTLQSVEGYGNLHAGGVTATVAGDAERNATAALEWRRTGEASFRAAHPLVRTSATRFAGSLFDLAPAGSYEVRVSLADPDGAPGTPQLASFATRTEVLPEPSLRTLYVAPGGNDGNTGTNPLLPLLTIQAAANRAQAGDLVAIAAGTYRETVDVPASGTASQPIVFRGAGLGTIVDGADAAIRAGVTWIGEANGVFAHATGFATGHVTTELGRLFRYDNLLDLQALAAGAPGGFWFDGAILRVKFPNGSSPATHQMHVARHEDGIVIDTQSFVRVENLTVQHFGASDFGKGVYLRFSSDCAVRNATLSENGAAGVWIKGGDRHRIEFNQFLDTSIFDWPWNSTKGSSAENNGVTLTDNVGRGHVIRGNVFDGTFNGIGPCGGSAPPGGTTNETDVYDNTLSRHTDDAFEPEGHCANVRIFRNTVRDSHMAFAIAPAAVGPLWLVRNIAYNFGNTRTSQQDGYIASALKVNSGFAQPIGPTYLYHNTFLTVAPTTDAVALLQPGTATGIVARNNVFAGTQYAIYKVNTLPWNGDYDLLYTTDGSRLVRWEGPNYPTLLAFQTNTSQEPNGLAAAPMLVNPGAGLFAPATGSPLIDSALPLPGINDVFAGAAPDIGALEVATLFSDGFES